MRGIPLATAFAVVFSIHCHRDDAVPNDAVAGCPPEWLQPTATDRAIVVPSGHPLVRAAAAGSQNYTCSEIHTDAGSSYAWAPSGPEATLKDCNGTAIGKHTVSDAGAAAPQWEMLDGAYVVARKVAGWTPDSSAVPWLLLVVDGRGGHGPLTRANYVQRVNTRGGKAPEAPCDASRAGTVEKVPYVADYFFYGR